MDAYHGWIMAGTALDAVETWAGKDAYLLRETGALGSGRCDGILIPTHWESPLKPGLHGVEVKVSRGDFLRGLKEGQFERYRKLFNTLYLVSPVGVCKTNELPKGIGHLVVSRRGDYGPVCACKRHAAWNPIEIDQKSLWKVVFDLGDQIRRRRNEEDRKNHQMQEKADEVLGRLMGRVSYHVGKMVSELK